MRLISISILSILLLTSCAKKPVYPDAPVSGETITIGIKTLEEEAPVFYSLRHKGKRIDFFVVKMKGKCSPILMRVQSVIPKLGYRADKQYVICRKCDIKYSIESLKAGFGSCYPIALRGKAEGGRYLIDKNLL